MYFEILKQTHDAGKSHLHIGDNFRLPLRQMMQIEGRFLF